MEWKTGLATYAVVWWVVLLAVLPWGNRQIDPADVAKGQAWGAPSRPRLVLKMAVTTMCAGVVWAFVYWVVDVDLFAIRKP
ncbi:MAG: DUF1467 family protein [Rhodospirillales bacterium]|jgi:predicted secreted protein|nr:DUF1467 family protein [Rhodospirillales bacterium]